MSEHDQQSTVVQYFRIKYPHGLIFAVPNGTYIKSYKTRKIMVKEGLTAGIPDLMIACGNDKFKGLFIEMKDVKKTKSSLTPRQVENIEKLNKLGYKATWCAGANAAIRIIDDYMRL